MSTRRRKCSERRRQEQASGTQHSGNKAEEEEFAKETQGTGREVSGQTGKHSVTEIKRGKSFKRGKEPSDLMPVLR